MALRSFGQRLGAAAASRTRSRSLATITVDLNYQEPHATLATGRYINQEDKGDVVDAFEARSCAMRDGRALEEPATLESMGFALEVHPTAVGDFRDDGARRRAGNLSSSVTSKSFRLIFGRIVFSRRVLEARRKSPVHSVQLRAH